MIAIALIALALYLGIKLPEAYARRTTYLSAAANYRLKESWLRRSLYWFGECRSGHESVDRDATRCEICLKGWGGSFLRLHIRRPVEAIIALKATADILGRCADKYERGAAWPWSPLPPPAAAEVDQMHALVGDQGTVSQKLFSEY
jgi:hypothetical protein